MDNDGPRLESLTRRLAECPADFLAEPRLKAAGVVQVAAVVSDLLCDLGGRPLTAAQADVFQLAAGARDRNRLRLTLIAAWLLHAAWFREKNLADRAYGLLATGLTELADLIPAEQCVAEPDRREELVRVCLNGLGLRPAGESLAQAQDRLATLNTVERQRVIKAALQAEERSRKIREAMAREAAKEASMKTMRE